MTLIFRQHQAPSQRLDLSALVPHLLAQFTALEIAALEIGTTREIIRVGDIFALTFGTPDAIRFEGGSERFDGVGQGLQAGSIHVEGDVGMDAGRLMRGGTLIIRGHAGPRAGSGMSGGRLEITGNAGERLGGPQAGEMAGMSGGLIIVRGNAGARAGDRMRRGTILIEGDAGAYAGSRMIAGTLVVAGRAGALPGYLQRRGTLVLGAVAEMSPGFVDCGVGDLVFQHVLARALAPHSKAVVSLLAKTLRRFGGDQAVLGKGELFVLNEGFTAT